MLKKSAYRDKTRRPTGLQTEMKTVMKTPLILVIMTALCESYTPAEVEKAFTDNEIVPDTLDVAPKKILNVSITKG